MIDMLIDTLFPSECLFCGQPVVHKTGAPGHICRNCIENRFPISRAYCPSCNSPLPGPELVLRGLCKCCDQGRWGIEGIVSIESYHRHSSIRPMLLGLKHRNQSQFARDLAFLLARTVRSRLSDRMFAGITAVPLHPSREKKRGYNQAALIGLRLSRYLGIPFQADVIRRLRRTMPQSGDSLARRMNVSGAFSLTGRPTRGRWLLVDDVFTTGATTRECGMLLIMNGCSSVCIATCAWALPRHRRSILRIEGEAIQ